MSTEANALEVIAHRINDVLGELKKINERAEREAKRFEGPPKQYAPADNAPKVAEAERLEIERRRQAHLANSDGMELI